MIQHVLSPEDETWAVEIGTQRFEHSTGQPRFAYTDRSGLDTHRIGAMAELAFARALSLDWPARVDTFRTLPDVDPNWEVRWSKDPKRVKVATDDPPGILVAHLSGRPPGFEIVGYIIAGSVQRTVPATDPGNRGWKAHFTDPYHLAPINEDFHDLCAWANGPDGWSCAYCGARFEHGTDPDVAAGGPGEAAGARPASRRAKAVRTRGVGSKDGAGPVPV